MALYKELKEAINSTPLTVHRFSVSMPKCLDISEYNITGCRINTYKNTISIDIIETVEKNIRDEYYDYDEVNELLNNDNIIYVRYYSSYGELVRMEKYSGIRYLGQEYSGMTYDKYEPLTTTLVFRFGKRSNIEVENKDVKEYGTADK